MNASDKLNKVFVYKSSYTQCQLYPLWLLESCFEINKFSCKSKSKSKSKKTLFNVGQCKQYNISSHLKWVLVADKSMHMIIYNKIHIK